jgi:hypothetical protein
MTFVKAAFVKATTALIAAFLFAAAPAQAGGDLSRQEPIVVTVELGIRDRQALQARAEKPEQRPALFHVT